MKKGFTLIELMTAVFIMGVLASFIVPKYMLSVNRAKESQCMANRVNIQMAEQIYMYDHNNAVNTDFSQLVSQHYLDRVPKCTAGGTYIWVSTNPPILACSVHYWPFTQTASSTLSAPGEDPVPTPVYAFSSDFDSMDKLNPLKGKWKIKNGELYNVGSIEHSLFFDSVSLTAKDYYINLTASTSGSYGIYYRSDGAKNPTGYLFYYDTAKRQFLVYNVVKGLVKSAIAKTDMPSNFSPNNQTHNLEISVSGTRQAIKVDGYVYLSLDNSLYASGTVGLNTKSSETDFDAATVTLL